jgi:hypothetical protein
MKNLLIIVFYKIDYNKIKEKGNVQETLIVALFDFASFGHHILFFVSATFRRHIVLLASTTFGHSSYGRLRLEFSKLEEGKKQQ